MGRTYMYIGLGMRLEVHVHWSCNIVLKHENYELECRLEAMRHMQHFTSIEEINMKTCVLWYNYYTQSCIPTYL